MSVSYIDTEDPVAYREASSISCWLKKRIVNYLVTMLLRDAIRE